MRHRPGLQVVAVDPAVHAPDPEQPLPVLVDERHPATAKRHAPLRHRRCSFQIRTAQLRRVARIVTVTRERACLPVHLVQAVTDRPHPEHPPSVLIERHDLVVDQAGRVRWIVHETGEGTRPRLEPVESALTCRCPRHFRFARANPERALPVLVERPHLVVAQTGRVLRIVQVAGEGPRLAIQAVEPALCADPECAPAVFEDDRDRVLAQTRGIDGVMHETGEGVGLLVVAIEPPAVGTYPKRAIPVNIEALQTVGRERSGVLSIVLVMGKVVAVVAVEAVPPSEPHEALVVLHHGDARCIDAFDLHVAERGGGQQRLGQRGGIGACLRLGVCGGSVTSRTRPAARTTRRIARKTLSMVFGRCLKTGPVLRFTQTDLLGTWRYVWRQNLSGLWLPLRSWAVAPGAVSLVDGYESSPPL